MSFWRELKRRNVFKVAAVYLVASWLIVQVIVNLAGPLSLPDVVGTVVVVLLAIGFPVALLVAWAYELTPEGLKRASELDDTASVSHITGQRLNYVVTILLAVLVGVFVVDGYLVRSESVSTQSSNGEAAGVQDGPPYRIAVMPMRSLSLDEQDHVFGEGLTLELITRLGKVDEFELPGATSTFVYQTRPETAEAIGEQLQVDYILETDMRVDAERLRVSARFLDLRAGTQAGLGPFNRPRGQELALQDDIAQAVTDALSVSLGVRVVDADQGGTDIAEAYDAYLRGRAALSRVAAADAVAFFRRAVALDADFGLAWIGLARAYDMLQLFEPARLGEIRALQRSAVQRALETAPDRWEPHALRARESVAQLDWIGAARAMEVAKDLGPALPADWANDFGGSFLVQVGRVEETAALYLEARSADPLSAQLAGATAWALDLAGRNDQALAEFERSKDLAGGAALFSLQHLHALLVRGDASRIEAFFAGQEFPEASALGDLAAAWQSPREATAVLRAALERATESTPGRAPAGWGVIAAHYGDSELALELLREAYLRRESRYTVFLWHPLLSEVRATRDFNELVAELGLDDYWREYGWPDYCRPLDDERFRCY